MELIEKLKSILKDNGVDEETAKAILAELEEAEEAKPEEESPAVPLEGEPEGEAIDQGEQEPEEGDAPAVEAAPLPEGEEAPIPEPLPEGTTDVTADIASAPVPEPEPAPIPQPDPEKEQLRTDLDELKKANEGLLARVDSLEEALRSAGVIEGEKPEKVGFTNPSAPANDPDDTDFSDFLRMANRKR